MGHYRTQNTNHLCFLRWTPIFRLFDDKDFSLEPELELEPGLEKELAAGVPPNVDDEASFLLLSVCCKLFNFPPKPGFEPAPEVEGEKMDSVSILDRFSSGSEVGMSLRREAMCASSEVSGSSFMSEEEMLTVS